MFTGAKIDKRNITTKRIEKNYLLCAKNSIKNGRPLRSTIYLRA